MGTPGEKKGPGRRTGRPGMYGKVHKSLVNVQRAQSGPHDSSFTQLGLVFVAHTKPKLSYKARYDQPTSPTITVPTDCPENISLRTLFLLLSFRPCIVWARNVFLKISFHLDETCFSSLKGWAQRNKLLGVHLSTTGLRVSSVVGGGGEGG